MHRTLSPPSPPRTRSSTESGGRVETACKSRSTQVDGTFVRTKTSPGRPIGSPTEEERVRRNREVHLVRPRISRSCRPSWQTRCTPLVLRRPCCPSRTEGLGPAPSGYQQCVRICTATAAYMVQPKALRSKAKWRGPSASSNVVSTEPSQRLPLNKTFTTMKSIGFERSPVHVLPQAQPARRRPRRPRATPEGEIWVAAYVDDLSIASSNKDIYQWFIKPRNRLINVGVRRT